MLTHYPQHLNDCLLDKNLDTYVILAIYDYIYNPMCMMLIKPFLEQNEDEIYTLRCHLKPVAFYLQIYMFDSGYYINHINEDLGIEQSWTSYNDGDDLFPLRESIGNWYEDICAQYKQIHCYTRRQLINWIEYQSLLK